MGFRVRKSVSDPNFSRRIHLALDEGLRGFADHMDTDAFQKGAAQLQHLAARGVCAMLCAERDPTHCHRSLIADYLTLQGLGVVHLIAPGESREHVLSPAARRESAALVYDRRLADSLACENLPKWRFSGGLAAPSALPGTGGFQ